MGSHKPLFSFIRLVDNSFYETPINMMTQTKNFFHISYDEGTMSIPKRDVALWLRGTKNFIERFRML